MNVVGFPRAGLRASVLVAVGVPEATGQERGKFIADFENALALEARHRGGNGVICGHNHHAKMRTIGGILHCDDDDWTENGTAPVAYCDGQLEMLQGGTPSRFKSRAAELATAS